MTYAAMQGHKDAVALLLSAGADGSGGADNGTRQPLHAASQAGHVDVVRMLLQAGGCVNARDDEGNTPLHLGAAEGHAEVCSALLDANADIVAEQAEGLTASDLAAEGNHTIILYSAFDNANSFGWAKCTRFPGATCRHRVCQNSTQQYKPPWKPPKKKIIPPPPKFGPTCREELVALAEKYCQDCA